MDKVLESILTNEKAVESIVGLAIFATSGYLGKMIIDFDEFCSATYMAERKYFGRILHSLERVKGTYKKEKNSTEFRVLFKQCLEYFQAGED